MNMFRDLTPQDEAEFREWPRDPNNFNPATDTINPVWHPVIQEECSAMRLGYLEHEALRSTFFRDHTMAPFTKVTNSHQSTTKCTKCGMDVHCNVLPLPNEIEIGGEAVALNCVPEEDR
tara:strand:+ start:1107 stop:1463 length:357 start_codon:yes stop_codon:yes gene_type:complete